jgi:hypothetical protein
VTRGWRKLHNEELHNLYSFPNIIRMMKSRRMRWAGHVARMGILVGKPEGKRLLGRPRRRWVDNIKMDLREIAWDGMDWIDLAQDRDRWRALVNRLINLRVPSNAGIISRVATQLVASQERLSSMSESNLILYMKFIFVIPTPTVCTTLREILPH